MDTVEVNRVFHDHECAYYDSRFAIVHDARSARQALAEVSGLLGRPLRAGERVLDAGCGTGWLAAGLRRACPDLSVVGADVSAGMLGACRDAGGWPLVQADAGRLPFGDRTFDVVVARGVLHHLPDVPGALAEWRRVARGAVVLVSEPTPAVERHGGVLVRALLPLLPDLDETADYWELAAMAANLHVFTRAELEELARKAGYREVRIGTTDFADTLLLTASYVVQGRVPAARRLPWRAADSLARLTDRVWWNRILPEGWRHTLAGVLRP